VSARFVYKIKPHGDVIGRTSIILTIFPHFWFQKILETAMEPIKKFAKSFPSSTVSKLTESAQSWLTHSNKIRGGRGETQGASYHSGGRGGSPRLLFNTMGQSKLKRRF
jgi:hypothetical protein